jgi:beta-lactamase class D
MAKNSSINRIFRLSAIALLVLGYCLSSFLLSAQVAAAPLDLALKFSKPVKIAQQIDFGRHFQESGVEGSILIYDLKNDRTYQHNPQRNTKAFLPASTFKILNSLVALETGIISDELAILTWDGTERVVPEWNRDLNMKEAIALSAIWFYQVLARRTGYERMQQWFSKVEYGNKEIGSPEDIDRFWLEGALRITPQQQIQFLRRLFNNELPFSERSLAIVKNIIIVEQTPDYTLRSKTGWVGFPDRQITPQIGWDVGYLERGDNVYFFATTLDINNDDDAALRTALTRLCLEDLQLL